MRRLLVWLVAVGVIAVTGLCVGCEPLLTALGGYLVLRDTPHPADAIVVLSGSVPDRILEGIDLYQAHLAPRIILTREPALPGSAALQARGGTIAEHHEQNLSIARQLDVPADAMTVLPTPVSSTVAEAHLVIDYLRGQGIHSILLVTSKSHSRRAAMTFRRFAGDDIQISICPSHYDPFMPATWWHNRAFVRRVVIEYGKLVNYLLIDRWCKA